MATDIAEVVLQAPYADFPTLAGQNEGDCMQIMYMLINFSEGVYYNASIKASF